MTDFGELFQPTSLSEQNSCQECKLVEASVHMAALQDGIEQIIKLCRDCEANLRMKAKRDRNG